MLNYFNYNEFDSPDEIGSGMPISKGGQMNDEFLFKLDEARMLAGHQDIERKHITKI